MNEVKPIENQPDGTAVTDVNARMGAAVQGLGNALVGKFQASGNVFNALELELKCTIMGEAIHMLTELLVEQSGGKHNDLTITELMIARVDKVAKAISESTKAPKILIPGGVPPGMRMNGSKHN
jgi:hypothetical protein